MSEKIISMARSAEKNNDKLFPVFQKSLESDTHTEFAATAYYANARPKIIDLIETAHATVRRHSGFPDLPFHTSRCSNEVRPWAEPFMKIVRTVVPFLPLFTEPVLQLRLKALIQTLCEDIDGFLSQQTFVSPQAVTPSVS
ncbi:hypothetical protein C8Q78DRAFT_799774 [Trametes maxima]|nr:hypothetical protein C8Q78DRAFT_799774 [Trametes maxima]